MNIPLMAFFHLPITVQRMKPYLLLPFLFVLLVQQAYSQPEYEKVEAWVAAFPKPAANVGSTEIARKLTEPFKTDTEKARALFSWIAHNIRYDCEKYRYPERVRFSGRTKEDVQREQEKWEADQLKQTLRKKKGVCEDYSRLFKVMCDSVGLEAVIIDGNARQFFRPFRKLPKGTDHTWNAVKIDGQWRLLDPTWAAGYADEEVTKFTADYQPGYFMTSPAWFVQDHFPQDPKWQLLETPVGREAFPEQALVNFGQITYLVEDFSPKAAKLAEVNDKMEIRVKFVKEPPALIVVSRNTKQLPVEQTKTDDGYTVLRFEAPGKGEITVFGGEKKGKKGWLLRYYQ